MDRTLRELTGITPIARIIWLTWARSEHVQKALGTMRQKNPGAFASIMVDCSHGNSSKNHLNQPKVAADVAAQISAGEEGITGIMFESNLKGGKQSSDKGRENLEYGVSITDGGFCPELNLRLGR